MGRTKAPRHDEAKPVSSSAGWHRKVQPFDWPQASHAHRGSTERNLRLVRRSDLLLSWAWSQRYGLILYHASPSTALSRILPTPMLRSIDSSLSTSASAARVVQGLQPDDLRGRAGYGRGVRDRLARGGLRRLVGLSETPRKIAACKPKPVLRKRRLLADGWSSRAAAFWSLNLGCTCLPGNRDSHRGESSLASMFINSAAKINNISLVDMLPI